MRKRSTNPLVSMKVWRLGLGFKKVGLLWSKRTAFKTAVSWMARGLKWAQSQRSRADSKIIRRKKRAATERTSSTLKFTTLQVKKRSQLKLIPIWILRVKNMKKMKRKIGRGERRRLNREMPF
jgi:hypothetical protein